MLLLHARSVKLQLHARVGVSGLLLIVSLEQSHCHKLWVPTLLRNRGREESDRVVVVREEVMSLDSRMSEVDVQGLGQQVCRHLSAGALDELDVTGLDALDE
eukprot:78817-Rhodomonas_salina.1